VTGDRQTVTGPADLTPMRLATARDLSIPDSAAASLAWPLQIRAVAGDRSPVRVVRRRHGNISRAPRRPSPAIALLRRSNRRDQGIPGDSVTTGPAHAIFSPTDALRLLAEVRKAGRLS
jgi:hypothetical protein